jgi:hypothetical protein
MQTVSGHHHQPPLSPTCCADQGDGKLPVDILARERYTDSSSFEAAVKNTDETILVTQDITVGELLERTRRHGEIRLVDGDDIFVLKHQNPIMPDAAREFLARGGPDTDD